MRGARGRQRAVRGPHPGGPVRMRPEPRLPAPSPGTDPGVFAAAGGAGSGVALPRTAAALVWQGLCADWGVWGREPEAAGIFAVECRGGVVGAWWRGPTGQMADQIWVPDPPASDPEPWLRRAAAGPGGTELRLPAAVGGARWVAAALRNGYRLVEVDPLMALALDAARPDGAPAGPPAPRAGAAGPVASGPVADAAEYEAALAVIESCFGGPRPLSRFFAPRGAARVYLARWAGAPAAAASACRDPASPAVRIYSVSTRPAYRRRGLARALLLHVLAAEARAGAGLAGLRTVDALVPYYERIGFRVVGRAQRFRRAPDP